MKYLVVGAGFSGAVIARELAIAGHNVKVIEVRDHVAGNAYDYTNEHGIRVHKYGPHLFHTNNKSVYDYLGKFTEWVPYQHKVKALLEDGHFATLPVNRQTKDLVGEDNVIDIFFRPYSKKMWGMELEALNPEILNRVPIRDDDNELYFPNDLYQAVPKDGYTRMVENILDHQNIEISLNTPYDKRNNSMYDHVFNSMPIDQYFEFKHGYLPYRSMRFETFTLPLPFALPTTTVNFTHDGPQTRVTEWKHIPQHGGNKYLTTLTFETPCCYTENNFERYYPVKDADGENRVNYQKYKEEKTENVTFIGRCGLYAYLDMHQAVNSALTIVRKFLSDTESISR